jgi:cysteine desulfurase
MGVMVMQRAIYLDHNATSPVRPRAAEAVAEALAHVGNPSSVHRMGQDARRRMDRARARIAALVGARERDVIFLSGGTEANDLALSGSGRERVLISAVEHPSVLNAVDGAEVIPVDGDGVIDVDALDRMLAADARPALVSVMLANNETGVVQPVADVARIARAHGALAHTDAVQAVGRMPVSLAALGVHMLTLSAHKIGGPQGIGALVTGGGATLSARIRGGGQEQGLRAGTENVPGIAGFGAAAEAAMGELDRMPALAALRERLEDGIKMIAPEARCIGARAARIPNTSCIAMPGVSAETQVMALDLAGIAVSAGAACSSGTVEASHVLEAMGEPEAANAIRVSLGWTSRSDDVQRFLEAWGALYGRAGRAAA